MLPNFTSYEVLIWAEISSLLNLNLNCIHFFSVSCLEKAFDMDRDTFLQEYGFDKPAKECSGKLVISDYKGRRVPEAVDLLRKHGYDDVRPYKGGFEDWKQHNGPIEQYR